MFEVLILMGAYANQEPGDTGSYHPFESLAPESLNVRLLGYVKDTTLPLIQDLAASEDGNYVYAACGDSGLVIYDISDPTKPFEVKKISLAEGEPSSVEVQGNYLYVSGRYPYYHGYFSVYDISDPENPVYLASSDTLIYEAYLTVVDSIVYASSNYTYSIDISDPYNPVILDSIGNGPQNMNYYCDSILYVLRERSGSPDDSTPVYLFDVSDPTNIRKINEIWHPGGQMSCVAAWRDTFFMSPSYGHTFLYVLGGIWADYIWDVTDPLDPELVWAAHVGHGGGYWVYLHSRFTYLSEILEVYDRKMNPDGFYQVGYYRNSAAGGKMIWTRGVIVMRAVYGFIPSPLAIFQFSGDTAFVDTSRKENDHIIWLRTVYSRPGLEFYLSQKAQVSFSLFNPTGQRVYHDDLGLLEPGPHRIKLWGPEPGIYFLILNTDNQKIIKKLVFTKPQG